MHEGTVARMRIFAPRMEINEARLRMATLPEGCEVSWTDGIWVPTVCVGGNVFVLPGVPRIYKVMLHALPESRVNAGGHSARSMADLETRLLEGDIAHLLLQVADRFTQLVVEADEKSDVAAAMDYLTVGIRDMEKARVK
jgi:molybdopterin-biosynthesis enzyme MoeA-like protein